MAIKFLGTVEQIKGLAKVAGPVRVLDLMARMYGCYPCTKGVYGFIADPGIGMTQRTRAEYFNFHRKEGAHYDKGNQQDSQHIKDYR